jgi:YggT family protein
VNTLVGVLAMLASGARVVVFAVAALAAVVCVIDWAVRTRRISPFNGIARFFRSAVEPIMAPVERRVVRAGGLPTSAPWWALVAVVVLGLLLITLLDLVISQLQGVAYATSMGAVGFYHLLVSWTFGILRLALFIRVIISWLPISPYSPWVRWTVVLTEPILRPLRQILPTIGPLDISPLVAYFVLGWIEGPLHRLV